MSKTYIHDTPGQSTTGHGTFFTALSKLKDASSDNAFLTVSLEREGNSWSFVIEAHDPCDKKDHSNCTVGAVMDHSSDIGDDKVKEDAHKLAKLVAQVFGQELELTGPFINDDLKN